MELSVPVHSRPVSSIDPMPCPKYALEIATADPENNSHLFKVIEPNRTTYHNIQVIGKQQ